MNAALLLQLWETGNTHPAARSALLHRVALMDGQEVAHASPGQLAHAVLQWRAPLFGEAMSCIADCPACGERMEFDLQHANFDTNAYDAGIPTIALNEPPYQVRARSPRLMDLEAHRGDEEALFASCVLEAHKGKKALRPEQLPEKVRERIGAELLGADPLLDLHLELKCPACAHAWSAPFDVAAYCWSEVERWAQRMLATIHQLARAYGWTESEVLALSAWRRERYLQLIAA